MTNPVETTYRAFLSYSHKDTSVAAWFHKKLEGWRIDRDLVGRETGVGPIPQTLRPIFRDRDDFAGGHSLADATIEALEASEFLIVLCSPNSAKSGYVNEEVRLFKTMGRSDRVIPVIIAGEPGAEELECFPPAVRFTVGKTGKITNQPAEPVAPDARDIGDGRIRAAAKIVAGLLGVRYDEIIQRARRAERKRKIQTAVAAATFAVISSTGGYFYWQSLHLKVQQELSQQEIAKLKSLVQNLIASSANASESPSAETTEALEDALKSVQQQANVGDERMAHALELLSQGKTAEAEELFRAVADEKAARIAQAETNIDEQKSETAAAYRNLGTIAGLGDPERAREAYTKALEYDPNHPEVLYWHGWLYLLAGDLTTAENSLTRLMELSTASGEMLGRYRAHLRLGEIVQQRGSLESALEHQQAAFEIAHERASERPEDFERQSDLSVSQEKVGDVLFLQGNLPAALDRFKASLAITERLAKSDPDDARWQRALCVSHEKVGVVLLAQGNLPAALDRFKASLTISERLAKSDPDNARWQRDLSLIQERVGKVLVAQGNLPAALDSFKAGLAIRERLAKSDPDNAGWQRDLSVLYDKVGGVLIAQRDLPAALDRFKASLTIRSRLVKLDPDNAEWQRDLALGHANLALVHRRRNHHETALANLRTGRAIIGHLVQLSSGHARWRNDLAWFDQQIAQLEN